MPLLDIFKKKKSAEKEKKPSEVKVEKKLPEEETKLEIEKPKTEISELVPKDKPRGEAWRVLKEPQITEKATNLTQKNQYVFKVWPRANKVEIKKAIEDLYGVDVISVKIIKVPAKKRRLGRVEGWRKGYKKAIVKIKEGEKIEVLPR